MPSTVETNKQKNPLPQQSNLVNSELSGKKSINDTVPSLNSIPSQDQINPNPIFVSLSESHVTLILYQIKIQSGDWKKHNNMKEL